MNRLALLVARLRLVKVLGAVLVISLLPTAVVESQTPSPALDRATRRRNRQAAQAMAAGSPTAAPEAAATPVPAPPGTETSSPPSDSTDAATTTTETVITASDGATFTSKEQVAVFNGDVLVLDPKFQLACHKKLTVYLNKAAPGSAATPTATATSLSGGAAPAAGAKNSPNGGIDHAVAEGHVIIIQERAATEGGEPKRSVGRADYATFDYKTGDMVLKGTPSVEQNGNTHVATAPYTVMTLRRDNSLLTVGPNRTLIPERKNTTDPVGPKRAGKGPGLLR